MLAVVRMAAVPTVTRHAAVVGATTGGAVGPARVDS